MQTKQATALATSARLTEHLAREARAVRESTRVLSETSEARAALREELGGTRIGAEVGDLLRKAQGAMRAASASQRKEAEAAKREVVAMRRLGRALQGPR